MNRILVAYATMAGSTVEVAQAVGEEITKSGYQVDILPISEIKDLKSLCRRGSWRADDHGLASGGIKIP